MPIKVVAATSKARKGKAGKARVQSYKKGGRTGKQFGGGFNQPLAGARAPMRPLGFKRGKSAKK